MDYAVVTKRNLRFIIKVTIFLKSWSNIWVDMRKKHGDVENQVGKLGIAGEMKQGSNKNGKFEE